MAVRARGAAARGQARRQNRSDLGTRVLTALPAVTFRQQLLELSWSMVLTVIFAGLATALWGALRADPNASHAENLTQLSSLFFLTIAASWAIARNLISLERTDHSCLHAAKPSSRF